VSKTGHTLAALAVGGYIALAVPHGALVGIAAALAGGLPDSLEGVVGFGPVGERRSLIPHRTLTHSPWGWLAVLALGLLLPALVTPWGPIAVGKGVAGLAIGALLHLALDLFSPTGIPLGHPFGARVSLGPYRTGRGNRFLYRTSTTGEWPLLAPFTLLLTAEAALIAIRAMGRGVPDVAALALKALTGT
jgi:inner membrane protein